MDNLRKVVIGILIIVIIVTTFVIYKIGMSAFEQRVTYQDGCFEIYRFGELMNEPCEIRLQHEREINNTNNFLYQFNGT